MWKSRSGGDGSRSNSDECDEANQQINIQTLMCPETPGTDNNALVVSNDSIAPDSLPPTYEHVLEETRLEEEQCATAAREEEQRGNKGKMADDDQNPEDEEETGGGRRSPVKAPQILHKSTKEFYKAVAKQWGITCKMSDHCRCFDCQSRYFDCDYDGDEQEKTDGGLGAGAPMFVSEVMHGTVCTLL